MLLKLGIAQGDKETKETPEEIMLLCLALERNALMLSSEVEVSWFWVVEMGKKGSQSECSTIVQ
jgi:hypothetical protein